MMSIAQKIKVLIVDDQVTSRLLLGDALQQLGFTQITVAGDGEQGAKIMSQQPHHLVISDFNMPKMDGLGLLQAVRSNPATKRAAFIMLTAQGDRALVQKAAALGANNVLAKPFTIEKMKAAIEAVFGGAEMTADVQFRRIHVIQGEYKVTNDPEVVLSTILGSCIAACMRDPVAGVGGMNHFLLPGQSNGSGGEATRYGVHLMELLINGLLKQGARRERLEAKIIGGAKTISGFSNVGEKNAEFAHQFLSDEGIRIVGSNTGGDVGRKLEYYPVSGRARQYPLSGAETQKTVALETAPTRIVVPKPADTSIEFFLRSPPP